MDTPSDARLFGMCLGSAIVALAVYLAVLTEYSAWWLFPIAIVVFAVLMFVDGYLGAA